ncbi:MAG TPA: DivIVA domain-containing protein [Firmicutes bacterium]|nr:DivIVA domain-containing protein [Bacillota bacterium]
MDLQEIKNKKFEKSAFGYKTDEVEDFLEEVALWAKKQDNENKELEGKLNILVNRIEEYRRDEDTLRDALISAQRIASSIQQEAKNKAEEILRTAEQEKEEILGSARQESMQILTAAKREAEQMHEEAMRQKEETVIQVKHQAEEEEANLVRIQRLVSEFKSQLISIYKEHLNLINKLPEQEKNTQAPEEPKEKADTKPQKESAPAASEQAVASPEPDEETRSSQKEEQVAKKEPTIRVSEAFKKEDMAKTRPVETQQKEKSPFPKSPYKLTITEKDNHTGNYESKFGDLKFGQNKR